MCTNWTQCTYFSFWKECASCGYMSLCFLSVCPDRILFNGMVYVISRVRTAVGRCGKLYARSEFHYVIRKSVAQIAVFVSWIFAWRAFGKLSHNRLCEKLRFNFNWYGLGMQIDSFQFICRDRGTYDETITILSIKWNEMNARAMMRDDMECAYGRINYWSWVFSSAEHSVLA